MSPKAGDVAATMRQAALHRRAASEAPQPGPPAAAPAPPAPGAPRREIRYALRLTPSVHRFLRQFALDHDVDASEVIRSLLHLLETDPALSDRVLDRVRDAEVPG